MSTLNRYRKPGGFIQLLKLIETFGHQKQEKFIGLVQDEDPSWAEALRSKLLTLERIFSWEGQVIAEVISKIPEKNLAVVMHGLSPERKEKILSFLSHSEKRRLESNVGESNPTPGEVAASMVKVIEVTRELISSGRVRLDHVDKELIIPDDIEEKLGHGSAPAKLDFHLEEEGGHGPTPSEEKSSPAQQAVMNGDMETLRSKVLQLQRENKQLHHDNKILKDKLDQIRKIA